MAENQENQYLVDLFDEDGNKKTFEHLDTVMRGDDEFVICIPYDDNESEVSDIVIFKITDADGESALEQVVDPDTLSAVYDIFRARNEDKFDFSD